MTRSGRDLGINSGVSVGAAAREGSRWDSIRPSIRLTDAWLPLKFLTFSFARSGAAALAPGVKPLGRGREIEDGRQLLGGIREFAVIHSGIAGNGQTGEIRERTEDAQSKARCDETSHYLIAAVQMLFLAKLLQLLQYCDHECNMFALSSFTYLVF